MMGLSLALRCAVIVTVLIVVTQVDRVDSQNWIGFTERYRVLNYRRCSRCLCRYWWGCSVWRSYQCNYYSTRTRCQRGYRHVNYNCNIPICSPTCANGGRCVSPNNCDCSGTDYTGPGCRTVVCSTTHPCYPGSCYDTNYCNCTAGFSKVGTTSLARPGCMEMETKPEIGRSTVILQNVLHAKNGELLYYFLLDGTDETYENTVVWSNQQDFNLISFEFESLYNEPEELPVRPVYVHEFEAGVVAGHVYLQIFNYLNIENTMQRYNFTCPSVSRDSPVTTFNCTIIEQEYKTNIEHGDTLTATLTAVTGGYRILTQSGGSTSRSYLTQPSSSKTLTFKFDFITARHCSYNETLHPCDSGAKLLDVGGDITKTPLDVQWKGWVDSDAYSSGVMMYYLELHKLVAKDNTFHLEEDKPLVPLETQEVMHVGGTATQELHTTSFTPPGPGMYSVLMEVRDNSNNSIYARRFVLYDPVSEVTLNPDSPYGLHVLSAEKDSGYKWQNKQTDILVDWQGYFRNKPHVDGHYLNEIKNFPVQFQDFSNLGIRNCEKFVFDFYDDVSEGRRTRSPIPNAEGITRFEYSYQIDNSARSQWNITGPLTSMTIPNNITNGGRVSIWVRAFDILGSMREANTTVYMDYTAPLLGPKDSSVPPNETEVLTLNVQSDKYQYASTFEFYAHDDESGIVQIALDITIDIPQRADIMVRKMVNASIEKYKVFNAPGCYPTKDRTKCFMEKQTVHIDNCWFMTENKDYLLTGNAYVDVTVYNQAHKTAVTNFTVTKLSDLKGLSVYNGPENVRITNVKADSFRVEWDPPKDTTCYGLNPIILVIVYTDSAGKRQALTHTLPSSSTYFDVGSLDAEKEYSVEVYSALQNNVRSNKYGEYSTKTQAVKEEAPLGIILGALGGVIFLLLIVVVVVVVLSRRGILHPRERAQRMKRAMTRKYRQTFYGGDADNVEGGGMSNPSYHEETVKYDNRRKRPETDIYYGGIDVDLVGIATVARNDVILDVILTTGHFATIYKATWNKGKTPETVVVKMLNQGHSDSDERLMRAKIQFLTNDVGHHPNILAIQGAVTDDTELGPFMLLEYCENGTLKEYLTKHKNDVTIQVQDNLFRVGRDISAGMEFLIGKGIVHRRLAARNVLLNWLNEVKITGFGPQTDEDEGQTGRIPIKWVAPECMTTLANATEKSDVWSYAVVLWEIFSMGDTPYGNTKSRDIPARLKKGMRLEKPEFCDDVWYEQMKKCWAYEANDRPSFAAVRSELDDLFVGTPGEDYYYDRR